MSRARLRARRELGLVGLLSTALLSTSVGLAVAQSGPRSVATAPEGQFTFNIPQRSLAAGLADIGAISGWRIAYAFALPSGVQSRAVSGTMSPPQAVGLLLAGTGIGYKVTRPGSIVLIDASEARADAANTEGAISLDEIDVQGNPATSEGTHSYYDPAVTVAGKIPVPIKEIPNSVSVVTRQRIEDQNLNSVDDALRQVPGVTAVNYGDGTSYFQSRGYPLDAQYDGVPVASGIQYLPQFDLSIYDRLEILKGPAGLLQGSGGPAGTVNFVRRLPFDHYAFTTDTQFGSWNFVRQTLDLSTPLNADGSARGRVILTGQDRDFFTDEGNEKHGTAYGVLQFDLTPQDTLTLSGAYQRQKLAPFDYGQSLYTNGTFLNVPRSAFFGADWSENNIALSEGYANLEHHFAGDWVSRTTVLDRHLNSPSRYAYMIGGVDPATNMSDYALQSGVLDQNLFGIDSSVSGSFDFFGRSSLLLFGANYSYQTQHQLSGYEDAGTYDIFSAPSALPNVTVPSTYGVDAHTQEGGLYGQTRLKLLDPLTLVLGGRVSFYDSETRTVVPTKENWQDGPSVTGKFTPYAGLVYDLTSTYSVYASYSEIFSPQTNLTASGTTVQPRTGDQYEAGLKATFLDNRVIATFAAFDINDDHRAVSDPENPLFYTTAGKARSRGLEAEVSGEISPGWSLTAGYTYLRTRYLSDPDYAGLALDPEEPNHTFKLWSKYTLQDGTFRGVSFGGGVRAVSSTQRGYGTEPTDFSRQPGYAVVDAQIGYKINDHAQVSLTARNLFDKRYFDRLPTSFFGTYGEPRSVMADLQIKW